MSFAINHLIGFGARRLDVARVCTDLGDISGTGTTGGNMTAGGGNAAAFDFNTSQGHTVSARKTTATSAYVSKDWGSGNTKNICKFVLYGPTTDFFFDTNSGTRSCKLQGSSTGAWGGEEVTLSTTSISSETTSMVITVDSGITAGEYRYHRWFFETSTSQSITCAEVRVWALA